MQKKLIQNRTTIEFSTELTATARGVKSELQHTMWVRRVGWGCGAREVAVSGGSLVLCYHCLSEMRKGVRQLTASLISMVARPKTSGAGGGGGGVGC